MNRYVTIVCGALLALAVVGSAWATPTYPGYNCTELVGYPINTTGTLTNAYGESLLSNGTVVGLSIYQPASPTELPENILASWNTSGNVSTVYNFEVGDYTNAYGDASGQYAVEHYGYGVYLYTTGGSPSLIPQLAGSSVYLAGMSQNGLIGGYFNGAAGFAYDVATSKYYTFGSSGSWVQSVNGTYAVGGDATHGDGFVWNENGGSPTYTLYSALAAAQGISDNGELVAGLTQGSSYKAVVYNSAGTLAGTYWAGEATGVNDNGLVVGDNSNVVYEDAAGQWNSSQAMAYFPGDNDPQGINLNHYAPNGVTFNIVQAVNDAGDILVWSGGWTSDPSDGSAVCTSYLLTPVATPEPSMLLLMASALTGLLAYAWRKRKS